MIKFLKHGCVMLLFSIFADIMGFGMLIALFILARFNMDIALILVMIVVVLLLMFFLYGTFVFCTIIKIDEEKIIEVLIFGRVVNKCYIKDIREVNIVRLFRGGDYIELWDDRKSNIENIERRKYIKFKKTEKSFTKIQGIWDNHIKTLKQVRY